MTADINAKLVRPKAYANLHIAGGPNVCVLRQEYDRDQLWLPLGTVFLFDAVPLNPAPPPYTKHNFKERAYVLLPDHARIMYPRDNSQYAKQYVLPYKEHKRLNNGAMKALKKHQFPLWDKRANCESKQVMDCLFTLDVFGHTREDIEDWCDENLRGRYFLRANRTITFELEFDCLMAKMYFS